MNQEALASKGLKFVDFEPNETLIDRALEKMSVVFGESPSDSSTSAVVRKTSSGFEGHLQIRSAVGTFAADVTGHDPSEVIEDLSRQVRSQLRVWKRDRELAQTPILN